jgi:hypothetical protein
MTVERVCSRVLLAEITPELVCRIGPETQDRRHAP